MNKFVLSVGGNCNNSKDLLLECFKWLEGEYSKVKFSQIYITPALNGVDEDYLNAVVIGASHDEYDNVLELMKFYERQCGRTKDSKLRGEVPIDIDIVIWNDKVLREKDYHQSYFMIGWNGLQEDYINL